VLVATLFYVGDADRAAKDQRVKTYPAATSVLGLMYIVMAVVSILATAHERAADQPKSLVAVRADTPPTIDGVLDDAVWAYAAVGSGLVQHDPDDGEPASEETTFQVSYDDDTLYIGVMCSDSNPGGIVSAVTRRDVWVERDVVGVFIDPRHDHKTGFLFAVGPSGWQLDGITFRDGDEDMTWDAVWEAKVALTPEGWSAEFAIPYNVLRLRLQEEYTWGINVQRNVSRKQETARWIHIPKGTNGFTSRFGHLTGIAGISPTPPGRVGALRREQRHRRGRHDRHTCLSRRRRSIRPVVGHVPQRHDQPGLRPGRSRPRSAQPRRVRDVLRGAAAVLC
jgi:hypothetical protein